MLLLEEILNSIKRDIQVNDVRIGPFWTAVWSSYCGLASTVSEHDHSSGAPVQEAGNLVNKTALELCNYYTSSSILERSIALAAINSLIEVPLQSCQNINAADLLMEYGKGKKVCIVGHFPFVPRLREMVDKLWVLEKRPRLDDLPADEADQILPQADVAAITGTALLNGTMDKLLALCRKDALVMVLGPTTPLSPLWFERGVSVVSGTIVTEPDLVLKLVSQGVVFSQFKGRGVKLLSMMKKNIGARS
ncbi:MAG: Rossmann-like domain-containing protein [Bacillota bacterium]